MSTIVSATIVVNLNGNVKLTRVNQKMALLSSVHVITASMRIAFFLSKAKSAFDLKVSDAVFVELRDHSLCRQKGLVVRSATVQKLAPKVFAITYLMAFV